eukprot:Em0014g459a
MDPGFAQDNPGWRCPNKCCRKVKSIRHDSWFSQSHLTLEQILEVTFLWTEDMPGETARKWIETEKIGGVGKVVEIDESKFGKRKYNRGRRREGQWVLGESEESKVQCVERLLRSKLPGYIVSCMLAAGFDTLDTLARMDVGNQPGNSIQIIEEYNSSNFPGDARIERFVQELRSSHNMPQALPSLRTVQRIVHHEYEVMNEGEFRFDQLANHINSYKCARVIVIGEDATRLVARVDYDPETNRLVGFVLPEDSFKSSKISKYALVYIAQPLSPGVPAFPLACIGTDNKFTADILLKRWSHISRKYVAGAHHLQLVQSTYSKDQHGLRERDIDCRDKQNFDSVLRITSSSVMAQISQIPDAKGTYVYLKALKAVLDSYLNKELSPLDRISNIWCAVFFFRYWRQWLLSVPSYNFITRNAYLCKELNAHALIIFMRTLRDHFSDGAALFSPWKLGSQSCEKTFRAVRSMTTTFSTVINVGMRGLLRRLHRLQIQFRLEAESAQNGIRYPHCEKHNNKDGSITRVTFSLQGVTDANIEDAVECGRKLAMKDIEMLGMELSLERNMEVENESAGSIIPEAEEDDEELDEVPPRSDVEITEITSKSRNHLEI